MLSFDLLLIAKQLPVSVTKAKSHLMWSIMLTKLLGDHTSNFGLICILISFWQPKQLSADVAMIKTHPLPHTYFITLTQFLVNYVPNLSLVGPFD